MKAQYGNCEELQLRTWNEVARLYREKHNEPLTPKHAEFIFRQAIKKLRDRMTNDRFFVLTRKEGT